MVKQNCCSIPSGAIFVGAWGGALQAALAAGVYYPQLSLTMNEDAGHVDSCDIKYTLNQKSLPNKNTRAGGTACSAMWVEKANVDMKIRCGKASNMAMAMLGKNAFVASGAVTNEDHIVKKNAVQTVQPMGNTFVPFNRIPDVTQTITVTGPGGTPTYVLGTDYLVGETGLLIPPGSSITDPTSPYATPNIRVSYTALDTIRLDGLVFTPQDVSILCDGFERSSGGQLQTHIYRARGMSDGMPVVADDFITLNMNFEILPDDRIPVTTSNPTSRYFHQLRG